MKKIFGMMLCSIMLLVYVCPVSALTKFKDWNTGEGNQYGTAEQLDSNSFLIKGKTGDVDENNTHTGPYAWSDAKEKLSEGITEEIHVNIDVDKMQVGEKFHVSLSLNDNESNYLTEMLINTEKMSDGTVQVTYGPDRNFNFIIKAEESGLYTYRWHMYKEDGESHFKFTLLKGDKVIGEETEDLKDDVHSGQELPDDAVAGYLWFVGIDANDGITVYNSLPVLNVDTEVKGDNLTVEDKNISEVLEESLNQVPELKELLENKNVTISLVSEEVTPTEEETKKFEDAVKNGNIANYFDISVIVSADGEESKHLTDLTKEIKLSAKVPTNLPSLKLGYERTYYIIREHDGKVEVLPTTLSEDKTTVTFSSDKFSTYALAYVDTKAEEVPNTLDNISTYLLLGGISVLAICGLVIYSKKKKLFN